MTRNAFIEQVVEEVTEGRSIPVTPKPSRLETIISRAVKYFNENADDAVEHEYIIIPKTIVGTPLFRNKRRVKLPECVEAVTGLQEVGALLNSGAQNINPDYRKTNFNYHLAVAGDSDTMLYGVMASYYADFIRNFVLRSLAFEYNPHSNMLTILGRDHFADLVAESYVHLCPEDLYNSDRFFRYVCGKVKVSFARVFGFVNAKTVGGLEININDIKNDGEQLIKDVEEEIKDDRNTVDFYDEF